MCFMLASQFARTEVGVCGHRGRPAQWPVGKDRSPGYDTATLPSHNWGVKTAREVGEKLSAAPPNPVQVSHSSIKYNTEKQHRYYSSIRVE